MANQFVKRLMFAVCAVLVGVAQATTYYVSPSGDDSNAGTSWEGAFKTVNKGFSFVNDHARGSTLVIDSGTYKLTSALAINGGNTESERGFVMSRTGNPDDVVIDGDGKYECLRIGKYIQISGITFSNGVNRTDCAAGGIRFPTGRASNAGECLAIVSNCIVTCCRNIYSTGTNGAAVVMYYNALLVDSVIRGNTAASWRGGGVLMVNNNAADGGSIFGGPVMRRCRIEGNTSFDSGAGVYVASYAGWSSIGGGLSEIDVEGCEIIGNKSGASGGGVFCPNNLDLRISGCVISNNVVTGGGGGVRFDAGLLSIADCLVASNNAATCGAGVDLTTSSVASTLVCKRTVFRNNVAGQGGGGRIYSTARAFFDGCRFEGNFANGGYGASTGGSGGGLILAGQDRTHLGYCSVSNCVFASNVASERGGGLSGTWNHWFRGAIVNCVFTNNSSYAQGGGLSIRENYENSTEVNAEPAIIRNSLFAFNETTLGTGVDVHGGGVCFVTRSNLFMENCTIVSNNVRSTSSGSGGIHHRWNGTLKNCIVAFNTVGGRPENNDTWTFDGASYINCCGYPEVPRFTAANGCINADPKFVDPGNGDFRLQPKVSPCIDKGQNVDWMMSSYVDPVSGKRVKVRDLAGVPRVYGGIVDIGCYEVWIPRGISISLY